MFPPWNGEHKPVASLVVFQMIPSPDLPGIHVLFTLSNRLPLTTTPGESWIEMPYNALSDRVFPRKSDPLPFKIVTPLPDPSMVLASSIALWELIIEIPDCPPSILLVLMFIGEFTTAMPVPEL